MYDLETLPLNYLRCRTFGHSWDEFVAVGKRKPLVGFRLSLLCVSCGMERHDGIDATGSVGTREYVMPPGYKLGGVMKRSEARIVYNKRRRRAALLKRREGAGDGLALVRGAG